MRQLIWHNYSTQSTRPNLNLQGKMVDFQLSPIESRVGAMDRGGKNNDLFFQEKIQKWADNWDNHAPNFWNSLKNWNVRLRISAPLWKL